MIYIRKPNMKCTLCDMLVIVINDYGVNCLPFLISTASYTISLQIYGINVYLHSAMR